MKEGDLMSHRRRTQHERLGEMINKRVLWSRLFPGEEEIFTLFVRIRQKIKARMVYQKKSQKIGVLREEKVKEALNDLKQKGEIHDFLPHGKLSYTDLIKGIDFIFVYIDGCYKTCRFSVTGEDWIQKHLQRHPEIPVLAIGLSENQKSIEKKILALKNAEIKKQ